MTYEDFVGLRGNRHRVLLTRAAASLRATLAAHDNRPLDEAWGDALADDESEAMAVISEANRARAVARARARGAGGPPA